MTTKTPNGNQSGLHSTHPDGEEGADMLPERQRRLATLHTQAADIEAAYTSPPGSGVQQAIARHDIEALEILYGWGAHQKVTPAQFIWYARNIFHDERTNSRTARDILAFSRLKEAALAAQLLTPAELFDLEVASSKVGLWASFSQIKKQLSSGELDHEYIEDQTRKQCERVTDVMIDVVYSRFRDKKPAP